MVEIDVALMNRSIPGHVCLTPSPRKRTEILLSLLASHPRSCQLRIRPNHHLLTLLPLES